jgi:penicillin-binding protein 2
VAGNDLFLTIDEKLQIAVEEMLREKKVDENGVPYEDQKRAAVIALDPNNGDVLAFVSTPGFDPNLFGRGLSSAQYRALVNDPDKPMYDRVMRGVYPSGSTIKPFMAMAGLYYNIVTPSTAEYCPGYFRLPGVSRPWTDLHVHGSVSMVTAIKVSCDVYFYSLANQLGIDRIHDYLTEFGFGQLTGIDIDGELSATLPSTAWKREYFKRKEAQQWYAGDTISVGIGQGYLTVTPLQLAHAVATLSKRGEGYQPRLIHAVRNTVTGEVKEVAPIPLAPVKVRDASSWDAVIQGMEEVVKPGGTAAVAFAGAPYAVAAKTGTAQVHGLAVGEKYNAAQLAERLRDNALFIAFAPAENPRVAVGVVVENGGHGGTAAAPIARRIFDLMLLTPEQLAAQEAKRAAISGAKPPATNTVVE